MKILINGIGGPTPRSIVRSLRWYSHYKQFEFIGTDINRYSRDLYDYSLYNRTLLVPPAGDPNYWPAMEQLVQEEAIEMALVQPELEVLAWAKRAETHQLPCPALLPSYKLAQLLTDKAKMTSVLEDTDWVPPSALINPGDESYKKAAGHLGYPFWIRSTSGSSGLGSLKVEDEKSLLNWLTINPKVQQFIGSQFLPGRNLACKLLYANGKLVRSACAERVNYIMAKVAPSGITGNTSFGRLLNEPALVELAVKAMDKLFAEAAAPKHGFFTVDFKEDEVGKPYITEVNVRHVAFSVCFAAGGATFAEDTVRILANDPTFDYRNKMYEFAEGLVFLRDVDAPPLLLKESELKTS